MLASVGPARRACSCPARSTRSGFGCRRTTRSVSTALATLDAGDCQPLAAVYGVGVIASAAILVRRYRRSGSVVRAQVRWVAAAGIVPIVLFLALFAVGNAVPGGVGDALWSAWILSTALLPIAIGVAILRYRLYDIDRIVSRTIAWAIVTGVLGPDVRGHDPRAAGGLWPRSPGTRRSSSRRRRSSPPACSSRSAARPASR